MSLYCLTWVWFGKVRFSVFQDLGLSLALFMKNTKKVQNVDVLKGLKSLVLVDKFWFE